MLDPDDLAVNDAILDRLHACWKRGDLELLVGAGVSIPSGVPSWDPLSRRLLEAFFAQDLARMDLQPEELERFATIFGERFGRTAIVDLVREMLEHQAQDGVAGQLRDRATELLGRDAAERLGPALTRLIREADADPRRDVAATFRDLLRQALYGHLRAADFAPIQYEVAASLRGSGPRGAYTFNYDNLLQAAIVDLHGRPVHTVTYRPGSDLGIPPEDAFVVHLHGYVPCPALLRPPGDRERVVGLGEQAPLVLSEKDYLHDVADWTDRALESVLRSERPILLVGMSLADPRLRRLLFERQRQLGGRGGPEVFAILTTRDPHTAEGPVERRVLRALHRYELRYWRGWGLTVLLVSDYDLIPSFLRRMRLGSDPRVWAVEGARWLQAHAPELNAVYGQAAQSRGSLLLIRTLEYLRARFEISRDEQLGVTVRLAVPLHGRHDAPDPDPSRWGALQAVFRHRESFVRDAQVYVGDGRWTARGRFQALDVEEGRADRLRIDRLDRPQGVAGAAWARGTPVDGDVTIDQYVDEAERRARARRRPFRSVRCVPVCEGSRWVPIGVVSLESNRSTPFWRDLGAADRRDLDTHLRRTFRALLGYPARRWPRAH